MNKIVRVYDEIERLYIELKELKKQDNQSYPKSNQSLIKVFDVFNDLLNQIEKFKTDYLEK